MVHRQFKCVFCANYFIFFILTVETDIDLHQARRRLTVMSDNKLVEGMGDVNLNENETTEV